MVQKNMKLAWWQLYLILFGGMGLMVLDAKAPLSLFGHEVTECSLLLLMYGLMVIWIHANRRILLQSPWLKENYERSGEQPIVMKKEFVATGQAIASGNDDHDRETSQIAELLFRQVER